MSTHRTALRTLTGVAIGLAVSAAVASSATPALAAPAAPPVGLSVSINDGVKEVRPNLDVTYTTKLSNAGAKAVTAQLVLTLPSYLTYKDNAGATMDKQNAAWPVTVDPGKTVTKTVTARIGAIPKTEHRVTGLATVYTGKTTGIPLIRSADASRIAGVADQPVAAKPAASAKVKAAAGEGRSASHNRWLLLGVAPVVAVVLLVAAAFLIWRGRGSRRGSSGHAI